MRKETLAASALWVILFVLVARKYSPAVAIGTDKAVNFVQELIMGSWWTVANKPENAPYLAALLDTETQNGIPKTMLVGLAYQESHFRPDIISGDTVSPAGALGIMQIVPKWHPDVNPLDPIASINYAAKYLRTLYNKFGTWELALQAYNWGEGNLTKYLTDGGDIPPETASYSAQILARVAESGQSVA